MDASRRDVAGRVAALLRSLAHHEPRGATTAQLARSSNLARPTAHRLLMVLMTDGLADRGADGRWLLGPELYLLGQAAARRYDVTALAQPVVRRLAVSTGQSAFFSARRGDETVCLLREEGSFPIRSHVLHEGIRFPLGVASAGQVILAHLADSEIDRYLERTELAPEYGEAHSESNVRSRVAETRDLGYAVNPGLVVEGSWGLAAAVFDANDEPMWALSLTGIEQKFTTEARASMGSLLLRSAHGLGRELRGRQARP